MAKPEVLHFGFGRTERRVTFEAKESALFEMPKRGGTEGIATLGDHNSTPLLLFASKRLRYDWSSMPESAEILEDYADRQRLDSPVPTFVQFHCSLYLVTHRVNARN
jgi:hypothetical protein